MWKNTVERVGLSMTTWRMSTACWVTKAAITPSPYATPTASPLHRRLHERLSMLFYTSVDPPVCPPNQTSNSNGKKNLKCPCKTNAVIERKPH